MSTLQRHARPYWHIDVSVWNDETGEHIRNMRFRSKAKSENTARHNALKAALRDWYWHRYRRLARIERVALSVQGRELTPVYIRPATC